MEGAADEQATARKVWPVSESWTKRAASDEITYLKHRLNQPRKATSDEKERVPDRA
jgi:hypothetical protein